MAAGKSRSFPFGKLRVRMTSWKEGFGYGNSNYNRT